MDFDLWYLGLKKGNSLVLIGMSIWSAALGPGTVDGSIPI